MASTKSLKPKPLPAVKVEPAPAKEGGPLTRSFVLSAEVSAEISRRALEEDRSASKIVDRALANAFGIAQ